MSVVYKIMELCQSNRTTITELETILGYSRGSIKKSSTQTLRSDRVIEIAEHFNVSPTYMLSDIQYDVCPICGVAYDPLNSEDIETHTIQHENFKLLQSKMGYLMTPSEAACKKRHALEALKNTELPDNEKEYNYETIILCDFTEYAKEMDYSTDISYSDFIRSHIAERKYANLLPENVFRAIASKHNVDLALNNAPLTTQIKTDKEFMENVSDMWRLPQDLKKDVYKAIRHAKRDYADSQQVII